MSRRMTMVLVGGALASGCAPDAGLALEDGPGMVRQELVAADETTSESYLDLIASLSVPSSVSEGEAFEIAVQGEIVGGTTSSVGAYGVYEDAQWAYDAAHRVSITGASIDRSGFNWGAQFEQTYVMPGRPPGEYPFTFVYGWRSGGHGYYDVAVDASVVVTSPSAPITLTVAQLQVFPAGAEKVQLRGELTLAEDSDGIAPDAEGIEVRLTTPTGPLYPQSYELPVGLASGSAGWGLCAAERDRTALQTLRLDSTSDPRVYSFVLVDTQSGILPGDYSKVSLEIAIGNDTGSIDLTLSETNGRYSL